MSPRHYYFGVEEKYNQNTVLLKRCVHDAALDLPTNWVILAANFSALWQTLWVAQAAVIPNHPTNLSLDLCHSKWSKRRWNITVELALA